MTENNRARAIDLAMGQIEKQFGKGSIMRLGEDAVLPGVQSISTGALTLDIALGVGGVPRGRIIEIFGPESSGKTTLALHIAAEAQKKGASPPSSMPSTPSTSIMPASWGSKPTTCWFPSPTPASRPWRSPRCWCAAAPSTCWWSTRWRPWCRGRKSKGKWATRTWGCRPA